MAIEKIRAVLGDGIADFVESLVKRVEALEKGKSPPEPPKPQQPPKNSGKQ